MNLTITAKCRECWMAWERIVADGEIRPGNAARMRLVGRALVEIDTLRESHAAACPDAEIVVTLHWDDA